LTSTQAGLIVRKVPNYKAPLDAVFHALADPTRRAVVERLCRGPASVSELAQPFQMALPSFSQHLEVLQKCGLVRSRKSGRVRTCRLAPRPLRSAQHWMDAQRAHWERRLGQLDRYLANLKERQR
jgi:DNA-binding transcriptional ArsR family regulator